jgi:hypothetical protein
MLKLSNRDDKKRNNGRVDSSKWDVHTHRVDLEIPRLSRLVQVDEDFLVLQSQLLQYNVHSMRERAPMVGVQGKLERVAVSSHVGWLDVGAH